MLPVKKEKPQPNKKKHNSALSLKLWTNTSE